MKNKLIFIVFSLLLWQGCYNEETLSPSNVTEFKYSLPQGDHEYDKRIVRWNEKGDFYILYKFDPKDIYFNLSTWEGSLYDSLKQKLGDGLNGLVADEKYVGDQLDLVEETFLNFYSDTALFCWMPAKVLLCSELKLTAYGWASDIDMHNGFDNIALNYGNAKIEDLAADREKKIRFKTDLNKLLFKRVFDRGKVQAPENFKSLSEYGGSIEYEEMYEKGFVDRHVNMTPQIDMQDYVNAIVSYSYDELNAEPEEGDNQPIGMLNRKKDVNGLIKKKYDYLIGYFKTTWQIDLQAIGNCLKQ